MFVYKNLHLNSLCIYCFTLISMTRKRGSGPWQKMVINKMYWQENNVRHRLQTKHINNKNVHYHPFRSLNEYVWQQIDMHSRWNSRYGQKQFMTQIFYLLKCISDKRISAISMEAKYLTRDKKCFPFHRISRCKITKQMVDFIRDHNLR